MSKYRNLIIVLGLSMILGIIFGCAGKVVITDGESPVVVITFPVNGATVSGDTVFVSATATDNKGVNRVEFWVDGIKSFTDNSSPYSFPWLILVFNDSTDHIVQAIAFDASGNVDT
ncbi:MAG: Ig-like domain-containing protein, partial [candidate division Zixibacteria bacterium]|nr:Ig-like domain-containing protein [candidate division Zixibacteria bacterium]